ncbi:sugar ABC transporter ATP-binding protein [Aeromicrobium endophyticum]|uniref:Sugar ABC transporter ATP-binding protein n=1 Tax=Aeromicrobium endophyticum TaxID=2292704 RepID=A0A371PBN4_9ACTN|nr:sugar ABC transporter ATP-binding protein [Aeromicrobium endophyticum]REK72958.1 sugar ABC transporter ATP-binding protein [Aeromicrobium endophyticum]
MTSFETEALRADGVTKRYGPALVLDRASLTLVGGRVDGLIGRNGAGKSTFVNVLTGRVGADGGSVAVAGAELELKGPAEALAAGIVAVPQELVMPMDMTVTEVVTFGAEPSRGVLLAPRAAERHVRALFESLGLDLDVRRRVRELPVSWQKVVLLAQALHRDARILILDEPTAAMNAEDCERVMTVVRRLRERGLAILYISHRFDEVEALCDRVTAMADGQVIDVMEQGEVTHDRLVRAITGPEVVATRPTRASAPRALRDSPVSLTATNLSGARLDGVDIEVVAGEILGVAGLPGSGAEEVFAQLAGRQRPRGGSVEVGGEPLTTAASANRLGVSLLPASRASASLPSEPVIENLVLPALRRVGRHGFMTVPASRRRAAAIIDRLSLRPVADRLLGQLSGGNQQRVLVGAKLLAEPRFLLLEDPTVGVDVAARAELHTLLWSLADEGLGLVVGSSDAEELLELCDRIVVLRRGRIVASWSAAEATEYALIGAMTGSIAAPAS